MFNNLNVNEHRFYCFKTFTFLKSYINSKRLAELAVSTYMFEKLAIGGANLTK